MLDNQNHEGLMVFLMGMIALVMLAVGATLLVDQTSDHAKTERALASDIAWQDEEMARLHTAVNLRREQLAQSQSKHSQTLEQIESVEVAIHHVSTRRDSVGQSVADLKAKISALEAECQVERAKIRQWLGSRVIGESLGNLVTTRGRIYQNAKIAAIESHGLSITHAGGAEFIPAADLPAAHRDRFPWEGPLVPLAQGPSPAAPIAAPRPPSQATRDARVETSKLEAARNTLRRAGVRLEAIQTEHHRALTMAGSASERSAPGSLDTWPEKIAALGQALSIAKTEYAKARAELVILAPDDPLLKQWRLP